MHVEGRSFVICNDMLNDIREACGNHRQKAIKKDKMQHLLH